jgi:hypothetical protein
MQQNPGVQELANANTGMFQFMMWTLKIGVSGKGLQAIAAANGLSNHAS